MTNEQTFTWWMTLLTVLGGGIVTGVVTVVGIVITLRHSRKVQQEDFNRQRLILGAERTIRLAAHDLDILRKWDAALDQCDAMRRRRRPPNVSIVQHLSASHDDLMAFWRTRNPGESTYEFLLIRPIVDRVDSIFGRVPGSDDVAASAAEAEMADAIVAGRSQLQSAIAEHESKADPPWMVRPAPGGRRIAD